VCVRVQPRQPSWVALFPSPAVMRASISFPSASLSGVDVDICRASSLEIPFTLILATLLPSLLANVSLAEERIAARSFFNFLHRRVAAEATTSSHVPRKVHFFAAWRELSVLPRRGAPDEQKDKLPEKCTLNVTFFGSTPAPGWWPSSPSPLLIVVVVRVHVCSRCPRLYGTPPPSFNGRF